MSSFDARKVVRPVVTLVTLLVAIYAVVHLWDYYNAEPWTRDGRVRGDIIQVSSDVSGLVTDVLVQDNQTVKKGQVLFKIDVARQQLDVEQARADLAKSKAGLAQMQANLREAKANIQQQKAAVDVAQSTLNLAVLNLHRSQVVAPSDGTLSNFSLRAGSYIKVGDNVDALIDRKQLYVVGYFEETKLNRIHVGDHATIQLMGDSQKIKAHVQGVASGIDDRERSTSSTLLANVNPTFTWVRLAQRVPVKIVLDEAPHNPLAFVAGRTATIHILENQPAKN